MTFVAARQFGDRIIIASDTMISDASLPRDDRLPGRLKAVVLHPQLTVAFAGLRDQGIDAIRDVGRAVRAGAGIAQVEDTLAATTLHYDGAVEFLIASHLAGASLKRVWNGQVSAPLTETCIGERDLFARLIEAEEDQPKHIVPSWFEEESYFTSAFDALFQGTHVSDTVGGFPIITVCAPGGHRYMMHAGVQAWDTIRGGQPLSDEQLAHRRSGMTQWSYTVQGARLGGVGVLGAIVPDAGIGYIYVPMLHDEPIAWRFQRAASNEQHAAIQQRFQAEIDGAAEQVGGGEEFVVQPSVRRELTPVQIEELRAYARNAPFATSLVFAEAAVRVRCQTFGAGRGVLVDLNISDADPVVIVKTVVDRINEAVMLQIRKYNVAGCWWRNHFRQMERDESLCFPIADGNGGQRGMSRG